MNVATLVDKFLKWCKKHRRPSTAGQYRSRLSTFRARFADTDSSALTPLDIQDWLDDAGEGKAADTQRALIIVVERLQQWAVEMKVIKEAILTGIEKPRGRTRRRYATAEEEEHRFEVFTANMRNLAEMQAECPSEAPSGPGRYSDLTDEEVAALSAHLSEAMGAPPLPPTQHSQSPRRCRRSAQRTSPRFRRG